MIESEKIQIVIAEKKRRPDRIDPLKGALFAKPPAKEFQRQKVFGASLAVRCPEAWGQGVDIYDESKAYLKSPDTPGQYYQGGGV